MTFQKWHQELKGGKSKYEMERIKRGATKKMLKAGFGRAEITPKGKIALRGYRGGVFSEGVRDELYTVVTAFEDSDGRKLLLVTVDVVKLSRFTTDDIAEAILETTGIPRDYIVFNCSHTHSGPGEDEGAGAPDGGQWVEYLQASVVEAARQAVDNLRPAELYASRTSIHLNVNRGVVTPYGEYFYMPDHKHLAPAAEGPTDPTLGILTVMDASEKLPMGIIANYACHPVFMGIMTRRISADYPGEFKRIIRNTTSAEAVFVQGACGDMHPMMPESGETGLVRFAEALAEKTLSHSYDSSHGALSDRYRLDDPRIASIYSEHLVEITEQAAESHYAVALKKRKEQIVRENGKVYFKAGLQVVKIGNDFAICGLPGEVVSELAMQIRWNSPFKHSWFSYYSTDQMGYISHRGGFIHGGYEAEHNAGLPREGYRMACRYVEILEELR